MSEEIDRILETSLRGTAAEREAWLAAQADRVRAIPDPMERFTIAAASSFGIRMSQYREGVTDYNVLKRNDIFDRIGPTLLPDLLVVTEPPYYELSEQGQANLGVWFSHAAARKAIQPDETIAWPVLRKQGPLLRRSATGRVVPGSPTPVWHVPVGISHRQHQSALIACDGRVHSDWSRLGMITVLYLAHRLGSEVYWECDVTWFRNRPPWVPWRRGYTYTGGAWPTAGEPGWSSV